METCTEHPETASKANRWYRFSLVTRCRCIIIGLEGVQLGGKNDKDTGTHGRSDELSSLGTSTSKGLIQATDVVSYSDLGCVVYLSDKSWNEGSDEHARLWLSAVNMMSAKKEPYKR